MVTIKGPVVIKNGKISENLANALIEESAKGTISFPFKATGLQLGTKTETVAETEPKTKYRRKK